MCFFIAVIEKESGFDLSEMTVGYAITCLSSEEIEGLPPGGGLESK